MKWTLREKCQNTEFFLLRIFPHSDWIRRGTEYLSLFCSIAGKYGPEKTPHLDTFHAVEMEWNQIKSEWNQAKVNAFQTTERNSSNYQSILSKVRIIFIKIQKYLLFSSLKFSSQN